MTRGREWRIREVDEAAVRRLAQEHSLSEAVARALVGRGLDSATAKDFLSPRLDAITPPEQLPGVDEQDRQRPIDGGHHVQQHGGFGAE